MDQFEANESTLNLIQNKIITIESFFENIEKITLTTHLMNMFLNGVKLNMQYKDGIYKIYNRKNVFIGIGTISENKLKRDVIL